MKCRLVISFICLNLLGLIGSLAAGEPAHDFARWEKEISAFERSDRTNPPAKGCILFIGSSTIRFWQSLPQDFPGLPVVNRGFGGSELEDATHFADRIIFPYEPGIIFLRAGGNDLWAGKTPERVFADFKDFVTTVRSRLPRTVIVYIGWNPSVARWKQADKEKEMNRLIEAHVRRTPGLKYADAWSIPLDAAGKPRPELFRADGLHFNARGYEELIRRVRPFLPAPAVKQVRLPGGVTAGALRG